VDTARIAHPAESPNTRAERALRLFEEHGSEIERIASEADVYFVPSEARTGSSCYRVDYENETCSCPDFAFGHGRACKHILAVGILNAKRRGASVRALAALEEDLAHELLDDEERQELRDRIICLRRRLGR
jgi:predicted nucleic acid-binding Zn finger protein